MYNKDNIIALRDKLRLSHFTIESTEPNTLYMLTSSGEVTIMLSMNRVHIFTYISKRTYNKVISKEVVLPADWRAETNGKQYVFVFEKNLEYEKDIANEILNQISNLEKSLNKKL